MAQEEMIVQYCREHGSITSLEAANRLGCMRLAARIATLEERGYLFSRRKEESKNRFGKKVYFTRYSLAGGPK